jgi:hypothetical protein
MFGFQHEKCKQHSTVSKRLVLSMTFSYLLHLRLCHVLLSDQPEPLQHLGGGNLTIAVLVHRVEEI